MNKFRKQFEYNRNSNILLIQSCKLLDNFYSKIANQSQVLLARSWCIIELALRWASSLSHGCSFSMCFFLYKKFILFFCWKWNKFNLFGAEVLDHKNKRSKRRALAYQCSVYRCSNLTAKRSSTQSTECTVRENITQ